MEVICTNLANYGAPSCGTTSFKWRARYPKTYGWTVFRASHQIVHSLALRGRWIDELIIIPMITVRVFFVYLHISMYSTCLFIYIWCSVGQAPHPQRGWVFSLASYGYPPLWPVVVGCLGCWWWVVCMYGWIDGWMDGCAKLYPSTILLSVNNNCFGWVLLSQCMCKMQAPWAQIQLEQRKAIEADRLDNCSEQYPWNSTW